MSVTTRLLFYLVLPLLLGGGSLALMSLTLENLGENPSAFAGIGLIALLLAMLPAAFYHFFIHSQLQHGFARMQDGSIYLPGELTLGALLTDRIDTWIPFQHQLRTSVCLQGHNEKLFVKLSLNIELTADKWGKRMAKHLDKALTQLEQTVQHALYTASQMDREMAYSLDGSILLNEDDERVLKSKFLSAMETIVIHGVHFPGNASGIHIERNVRKVPQNIPMAALSNSSREEGELADDELELDEGLLRSLGV